MVAAGTTVGLAAHATASTEVNTTAIVHRAVGATFVGTGATGTDMAVQRQCHFEIYKDIAGQYRWRLRDTNGIIIATPGESFTRRETAVASIRNVCSCCQDAVIVDV